MNFILAVPAVFLAASPVGAASLSQDPLTQAFGQARRVVIDNQRRPRSAHEPCNPPTVVVDGSGNIYKNGRKIGSSARAFKLSCVDSVAWVGGIWNELFKDEAKIGRDAFNFQISAYTGDVAWSDQNRHAFKNSEDLGGYVVKLGINHYTGDAVWIDTWGKLFKHRQVIGDSAVDFHLKPDGAIVWRDSRGNIRHHP